MERFEVDPGHRVLFYERDRYLIHHLERFVEAGLAAGEAVIAIATKPHLELLKSALQGRGIDLDAACAQRHYLPLEANDTLAKLVVDGLPDEGRFADVVGSIVERARRSARAGARLR